MPINISPTTPPPRIGKIGPYTVFLTPDPSQKPDLPETTGTVQPIQSHPVMAPPAQFYKQEPSSLDFFWDFVSKLQTAHESLDEHVAHWIGLNQSKYQWALDDYNEINGKNHTEEAAQVKPGKVQT